MHEVSGKRYLEVKEMIPAGKADWKPVSEGKWMPFDGGSNGGKWLHDPKNAAATITAKMDADVCRRF